MSDDMNKFKIFTVPGKTFQTNYILTLAKQTNEYAHMIFIVQL